MAMRLIAIEAPHRENTSLADISWRIESLGSDCLIGLVQRKFGAEPLGLLRFSTARMSALLPALETRFAGLGAPG